jgi:hypothetical protein
MGRIIVDEDTGEVLKRLEDGTRILPPNSARYLARTAELLPVNEKRHYIKLYGGSLLKILSGEGLSGADLTVLLTMAVHIQYETGLIAHDNGKPLRVKALINMTKLSERAVYNSIETLIRKGIIAKVRTRQEIKYYGNPFIFMRGVKINKTLYSMFRKTEYSKLES